MRLGELIGGCIRSHLRARSRDEALIELVDALEEVGRIGSEAREEVLLSLLKRESTASTGVGQGVAIPHAKVDCVKEFTGALGVSKHGIPFGAVDKQAVHVVFLFLSPARAISGHLKLMAHIGGILRHPDFTRLLREAQGLPEIIGILEDAERYIFRRGGAEEEI